MKAHLLVLSYQGRPLLAECLPSLVRAVELARTPCALSVIDNGSTDGTQEYLGARFPGVGVFHEPNRGLCSFNAVLPRVEEPVALLLNNDIKLGPSSIDPLVAVFRDRDDAFMSAPQCWTFDGRQYEGMRTRIRMRFGLVEASARMPGYERLIDQPGLTASAGPVLAVHRERFLELGGYDPLYLPGRLEDLDLCFRGYLAGWKAYYVPEARAYHKGGASFDAAYGRAGSDLLALRNTLLFVWKNLRGRSRLAEHVASLPVRALYSLVSSAFGAPREKAPFLAALLGALQHLRAALSARRRFVRQAHGRAGEQEFFARFGV